MAELSPEWRKTELEYEKAIGKFVANFSRLEYGLRRLMCQYFDDKADCAGMLIEHCDLMKLIDGYRLMLEATRLDADGKIEGFIKEFRKINEARVRIVHGTWLPNKDGFGAWKTPSGNPKSGQMIYFTSLAELDALAKRCFNLAIEVWGKV